MQLSFYRQRFTTIIFPCEFSQTMCDKLCIFSPSANQLHLLWLLFVCNFTLETCFRWSFSSSHLAVHSVSLARYVSVIASWDELGLFLVRGFPPINSVARPPNSAGSHLWPTSSWSCEPRACQTSCLALSRTSRWALVLVGEPQQDERPCLPHCSVELLCFWGSPPCPRCTCQGWQVAQGGPIRLRQLLLWLQGISYQALVRSLPNNFRCLAD